MILKIPDFEGDSIAISVKEAVLRLGELYFNLFISVVIAVLIFRKEKKIFIVCFTFKEVSIVFLKEVFFSKEAIFEENDLVSLC